MTRSETAPMIVAQPSPPVDDTALLSTLVQSGAALVAIIAGLLVARLVALVGERVSLERRVHELEVNCEERRKDLAAARQAKLDDDGDDFIEQLISEYFQHPTRSFKSFFEVYAGDERSPEELRPYFEHFKARVVEIRDELNVMSLSQQDEPEDWTEQRAGLLARYPRFRDSEIAEHWLDRLEDEWNRRTPAVESPFGISSHMLGSMLVSPEIRAARLSIESNYQRDLRRNEDDAEASLRDVELELKHARRALQAISRPQGLILATLVLAGIAVAGMVLPLLQMTFGQQPLSTGMRALYVGLFIASLVVFFVYLGVEMRRIMRRPR